MNAPYTPNVTAAKNGSAPQEISTPGSVWSNILDRLSAVEERPTLVDAIEVSHHTTRSSAQYVVIHNAVSGTYLRLDPKEYELLPLMDGTRTTKALVVAYFQRHGVLAVSRVAGLVRQLREHEFLVERPLDVYGALRRVLRPRDAMMVLSLVLRSFVRSEVTIGGIDGLLDSWYRSWGRFFFTRFALLVGILLGILGPILFVLELTDSRYRLLSFNSSYVWGIALSVLLLLISLAVHELGHGLAVKHAGRHVNRAGVMLFYGLPAVFVDTTDVWMAGTRMRLLASFAGPWTGLVLGALSAAGAYLLPTSALGEFLFAWSFVILVSNLYNLNPLLELDGYYMLVDLIEKPMLRARALAFVRTALWRKLQSRERFSREELFFAFYGGCAVLYGALTLVLAGGAWERRIAPQAAAALSGGPVSQAVVIAIGVVVAATVVFALWKLAARVMVWFARQFRTLGQHAQAFRHGQAVAALRAVPLWKGVPRNQLLDIARVVNLEAVAAGTDVVREGDVGDRFYVIQSGSFEVTIGGVVVNHLARGDYFGERALLYDAPRAATVSSLERSRVFTLNRDQFRSLIQNDLYTRTRLDSAIHFRTDLQEMRVLENLSSSEIDVLVARLVPQHVDAGGLIIRQGEHGDRFYLIRSGLVEVERDGAPLAVLGRGDAFGEIALLMDCPRTASVRALEPTELLWLDAADFHDILANYCGQSVWLRKLSLARLEEQRQATPTEADSPGAVSTSGAG